MKEMGRKRQFSLQKKKSEEKKLIRMIDGCRRSKVRALFRVRRGGIFCTDDQVENTNSKALENVFTSFLLLRTKRHEQANIHALQHSQEMNTSRILESVRF